MKAYKFEVVVLDFNESPQEDIEYELTRSKHLHAHIISSDVADIGEWDDDHPMNKEGCDHSVYFKSKASQDQKPSQ